MKILYIANARIPTPRAYGLQIMKTCEAFARAGAIVELAVPTRKDDSAEDPFGYYGVQTSFAMTKLAVPDFLAYGSLGFLISAVLYSEKARWLKAFWEADAVYSRDALVLLQYILLGRPLIFEAHAKPSFASRIVAKRARRIIVISHGLKEAYERVGVRSEKIIVAPDAVDARLFDHAPERAEARALVGLPQDARIALYAGHLYARKGADTLAHSAVLEPEITFVFVGGTPNDLAGFQKRWGKVHNITIVGHVAHEKIPLYLRSADVLVLPNSGRDEDSARFTSPMKLFEYMASGTPIVASAVPAIEEVLTGEEAILVAPDSAHALAQGIEAVFADQPQAQSRAQSALTKVKKYTWGKRADSILAALRSGC
jgi:glycosyltransferase involved in cell wall biosynthesis